MPNDQVDRIHAKLGTRIAMLVSQAIVATHNRMHDIKHRLAMHVFHSISDEISDEVDVTLGPFLKMLHDETPEDHPAYPAIKFMHTATGQLKALAGAGLQMSGLLGTIAAVMNNELAATVYTLVGSNPGQLPDVSTVVQSYVSGLVGHDESLHAIGAQGIQYGWADRMLALGYNRPDPSIVLDLYRRGEIIQEDAVSYLRWNGITEPDANKILLLSDIPVSPADAALAVLRGNMTQADGEKIAADSGISADSFKILIGNTGEPPGLMQLLEAYRRGFIDQATLERGILQSRYRNEWIPMLEKLRYAPMSTSDAARAVVQDQMDLASGKNIADQNGLDPGAFDIIVATEGNPLSRTEMSELFNRGLASQGQFDQAMRESRLKNKYNGLAFELRARLLSEGTVTRAVRFGEMSHADAVTKIMQLGYSQSDAATVIATGSGERLYSFKERVVSSVVTMYQDGIMSADDARSLIRSLGYSDDEITYIIQSAEFHRQSHVINTVVTAIKTKFLQHHIKEAEASGLLDGIGIPATNRDYLLKVWKVEQGAFVRVLTPAQIVKAVKMDLITPDEGTARLVALGYVEADATLLIEGA